MAAARQVLPAPGTARRAAAAREVLRALWESPIPALLQDERFRLVDVNEAGAGALGHPRARLLGVDPLELQPVEDRDGNLAERAVLADTAARGEPLPPLQRRFVDARGQPRWFTLAVSNVAERGQPALWLTVLQDSSAEAAARHQARRAQDELAQWFELSGNGMLMYDASGLIVRCNAALESLVERVPEVLGDATPELQALLGWGAGGMAPALLPGAPAIEHEALIALADGRRRRLSVRLACWADEQGQRRVMAVVEDRSAEEERDLAQLEIGMLMDTASVGVATYDPARGWLAPRAGGRRPSTAPRRGERRASGVLTGVSRDLVEPDSLPEFERLQRALRAGESAEVRYAVRHPEHGTRWLLTRVEPGQLSGGRPTTSVVTLDVTDQESAQRRNEQLLRELTTILDTSTAGVAYLRGPLLVRCNHRFERLLGIEPGAAAGATLDEVFARHFGPLPGVRDALMALEQGQPFEAELALERDGQATQWCSLSVRRAAAGQGPVEAVAVLTDVTRLKAQQAELEKLLRDRELMFSLSEVGIVYQRGARIERANQAMATLTGYATPELGTLDPAELYEDARACVEFEARVAQGLREQGRYSGERRLRRRDGGLTWVQVAVRQVDGDDAAAGLISSFVDVDERHRARESLALQAERTRAILNSVLVGIVTVSDRGIEWMNRSARRMFGGELADFVGEPLSTVATTEPEHPFRSPGHLQQLRDGHAETFECRLQGRDGRQFWVAGNAVLTPQPAGGGAPELTIALLDIDSRRRAEASILRAQASLQRVIETAPLAIALFDGATLRVQQLNQTAATFFGRPVGEVLGATLEAACAPAQAAALRGWLQAVAGGGGARQHEWREAGRDPAPEAGRDAADAAEGAQGARVWDCRLAPLDEGGVSAAQLLLVASDVTEQRAAERARLKAAIAQREVLVREVHHRIKNNLQGVAGLLQQNAARHPELAPALTEAVGQVQAIAQVYGLQVGARGPLQVAGLLRAIAQSVQRSFGHVIAFEIDGEVAQLLPEVEAIPVALTVNELLSNAVKHGHGGEVRCRLAARGDAVIICIANAGVLAAGFDLAQVRGGVSGLGLVRALLPRRSSALALVQEGGQVVATVELRPPSVLRPEAAGVPRAG